MNKRITAGTGALGALLAMPGVAQADDFKVKNLDDGAVPGPPGSLRRAVEEANANVGDDRIVFASKLSGTINLTATAIYPDTADASGDLEIVGSGARRLAVNADDGFPAFVAFANPFMGASPMDVSISGLRITGGNNTSAFFGDAGGGIQVYGEVDLTLSKVTIAGNTSTEDGGGVGVLPAGEQPNLTISNSTIANNSADENGGGISFPDGDFSISNSTVSGNSAVNEGGGIHLNDGQNSDDIRNSTITGNTAGTGGGVYEGSEGATVRGSIIAGNSATNYDDLEGETWPISFSITGRDGAPTITDQGGNIFDVDPKLKPLRNNGGPTNTHAFKKSPAKNKLPKAETPKQDQRGAKRKRRGDIGAYELVKCEGVIVNRVGTAKKDKLRGTKKKDGILGLGGNDKLAGKKGKDGLCGGRGKDKLKGGPGKDKLDGGPGKDNEVQ
jgi:RTX calcium-binding nonapeptide repeat (4 copies)